MSYRVLFQKVSESSLSIKIEVPLHYKLGMRIMEILAIDLEPLVVEVVDGVETIYVALNPIATLRLRDSDPQSKYFTCDLVFDLLVPIPLNEDN